MVLSIAAPQPFDSLLSLQGKVALVTGGSRGIGRQVVARLAQAGAKVVFTGRGLTALEAAEKEFRAAGYDVTCLQSDVSVVVDSKKAVEFTVEKYGRLDILINNAASFPFSTGLSMSEDTWDKCFAVDSKGNFFLAKFATEEMIREGHGGRIVNFLSTAALNPTPPLIAYGAAKQAVWYFTQTLASELAPYRITVNAVTPGATMTEERIDAFSGDTAVMQEFIEKSGNEGLNVPAEIEKMAGGTNGMAEMLEKSMPMGRTGFPDDLAKAVLFLASDMGEYVSGVNIVVDGAQSLKNPMMPSGGIGDLVHETATDASKAQAQVETPTPPTASPVLSGDSGLTGRWQAQMNTPMGPQTITLNYHVTGSSLTGTVGIMGKEVPVEDGVVTSDSFTHKCTIKAGPMKAKGVITGRSDGNQITGSIKGPMGTMAFTGSRLQ